MTTLEIKRLDHVGSNGILNGSISSPSKSPHRVSNGSQHFHNREFSPQPGGDTATNTSSSKEVEIPINIIKSQSYGTLTATTASAEANHQQSPVTSPLVAIRSRNLSVASEKNNRNTTTSSNNPDGVVGAVSSSPRSNTNSLNKLQKSDLNISTGDVNNSDVRFNKYGFIDKSGSGGGDTLPKTLKKATAGDATSLNSSSAQQPQNLKDYLQNSDVEQFSEHTPIKVIRERERKWMEMLSNYDEWMRKRFKKVRSRCRKGIPQSMRSKAWMYLTGAILAKERRPNYYVECLENKSNVDITR
jgi:hypothetical protein